MKSFYFNIKIYDKLKLYTLLWNITKNYYTAYIYFYVNERLLNFLLLINNINIIMSNSNYYFSIKLKISETQSPTKQYILSNTYKVSNVNRKANRHKQSNAYKLLRMESIVSFM